MFFPDLAHNVIYMKRFNTNTGAADVFEFHSQQQAREQQAENPGLAFAPLDGIYGYERYHQQSQRGDRKAEKARFYRKGGKEK